MPSLVEIGLHTATRERRSFGVFFVTLGVAYFILNGRRHFEINCYVASQFSLKSAKILSFSKSKFCWFGRCGQNSGKKVL